MTRLASIHASSKAGISKGTSGAAARESAARPPSAAIAGGGATSLEHNLHSAHGPSEQARTPVLASHRTLVLDSAYRPIGFVGWQQAVSLDWVGRADVLEYYPDIVINTVSMELPLPAVLRFPEYVHKGKRCGWRVPLTRRNILLRDRNTCQYCGATRDLSIDHVLPVSKGGTFSWSNCVAACRACNQKKGDRTLAQIGWRPKHQPREPSTMELSPMQVSAYAEKIRSVPKAWENYLPKSYNKAL